MAAIIKFICDGCGEDLTTTGNCVDYRLALVVESVPNAGPTATLLAVTPPIPSNCYFCGLQCLRKWLEGRS